MLFSGDAGHGLEPVGKVGSALFDCPVLHGVGNDIGNLQIQVLAVLDGFLQGFVGLLGKPGLHCGVVKNHG